MKIDIIQTAAEKKNEFEILFDDRTVYRAKLPFLEIGGVFGLEKLREITVYDTDGKIAYETVYKYFDNTIEELIPLKFLITKSQKFHQIKFESKNKQDDIYIYYIMEEIAKGYYLIKCQENFYKCYSVEDGLIRHISIYNENEEQIAELLKPNIIKDGKDEYRIYLKDKNESIKNALSMFALYLDRTDYNSAYLVRRGRDIHIVKTISKVNKFYDKNWVKNNFEVGDYYEKIELEGKKIVSDIKRGFKIAGIVFAICVVLAVIFCIVYGKNL